MLLTLCCAVAVLSVAAAKTVDFRSAGGRPGSMDLNVCQGNAAIFNRTVQALDPGDAFLVPAGYTFCLIGGISITGKVNITLLIDGKLKFWAPDPLLTNLKEWPVDSTGHVKECLYFEDMSSFVVTTSALARLRSLNDTARAAALRQQHLRSLIAAPHSTSAATIDGSGANWWGAIKYLIRAEDRPRLFHVEHSHNMLIEGILFLNSPYWTTWVHNIVNYEVSHSAISAKVDPDARTHDPIELEAFNTDGFDIAGQNMWVHDSYVWNQDDCVDVKGPSEYFLSSDGSVRRRHPLFYDRAAALAAPTEVVRSSPVDLSGLPVDHPLRNHTPRDGDTPALAGLGHGVCAENVLVERVNASGLGLTIGSLAGSDCVRNVTFKDSTMVNTFKGIYIKERWDDTPTHTGVVRDILYENLVFTEPEQFAIWIGPAQQLDTSNACSLSWPFIGQCPMASGIDFRNITVRNLTIINPLQSPGVIIGNETNPMQVLFDHVVVTNGDREPFGSFYYACSGVNGTAVGNTSPAPLCFNGGCLHDGECYSKTVGVQCCSGRTHETLDCMKDGEAALRCGCLGSGSCARKASGCCSSHCKETVKCAIDGVSCECE